MQKLPRYIRSHDSEAKVIPTTHAVFHPSSGLAMKHIESTDAERYTYSTCGRPDEQGSCNGDKQNVIYYLKVHGI